AWSVPLSATRRQCTVMIERPAADGPPAGRGRGAARPDIATIYTREAARATMIAGRIRAAQARQIAAPWACDASIYDCTRAADEGVLLVGDAASFIEPLSSAGVQKALLSAWRAAVVTNTTLKHPALASAARDLYSQRERDVYAESMNRAGAFFAEAASTYGSPFWSIRAGQTQKDVRARAHELPPWADEALAKDAGGRAAFEYLRGADGVRLRLSETLRFESVAAIEGREVVLRDGVVLPGGAGAVPFAAGVDLPALARLARGGRDVPALIAAYQAEVGRVPVTGLLTGLSLLVAHRALVAEGNRS